MILKFAAPWSENVDLGVNSRPARSGEPGRLSVHRWLRARKPGPVLVVDAPRLDWARPYGMVRPLFPRSRAGDAGARGHNCCAGRWPDQQDLPSGAAAGTWSRRAAPDARVDLHERVRLPCEPQPRERSHREDRL